MRGLLRCYEFNTFVSESPQVNPFKQWLSRPSRTGTVAMCSSSMTLSRRYFWIVSGPPPIRASIREAAMRARLLLANASSYEMEGRIAFIARGGFA